MAQKPCFIGGYFFTLLLSVSMVLFISSLFSFPATNWREVSQQDVMNGQAAQRFEEMLEAHFLGANRMGDIWTQLNHGVLNTAKPGALVGKNGFLFSDEEWKIFDGDAQFKTRMNEIKHVKDQLAEQNIALLVAVIPAKSRVYSQLLNHSWPIQKQRAYAKIMQQMQQHNVVAPNLANKMISSAKEALMFWPQDTHWTPAGANDVAQSLYEASKALSLNLGPKKEWSVHVEPQEYRFDLVQFTQQRASDPEQFDVYKLLAKHTDLFGEREVPIVLVGTSYSALDVWNFEPALQMAFGLEVLNLAQKGEGPFLPMEKILAKNTLSEVGAQLVIWEIPERYFFMSNETILAQQGEGG